MERCRRSYRERQPAVHDFCFLHLLEGHYEKRGVECTLLRRERRKPFGRVLAFTHPRGHCAEAVVHAVPSCALSTVTVEEKIPKQRGHLDSAKPKVALVFLSLVSIGPAVSSQTDGNPSAWRMPFPTSSPMEVNRIS